MQISFITGNTNKFNEAYAIIPELVQLDIDLPEVQEIDPKKIIEAKLDAAFEHHEGPFIVEDISLYIEGMNGLPGPLIKWFLGTVGTEGLVKLTKSFGGASKITALIGYASSHDDVHFFEGTISGNIVAPRGEVGFGFDPIFEPDGHNQTFAEMGPDEKNKISHRKVAFTALKEYLDTTSEK